MLCRRLSTKSRRWRSERSDAVLAAFRLVFQNNSSIRPSSCEFQDPPFRLYALRAPSLGDSLALSDLELRPARLYRQMASGMSQQSLPTARGLMDLILN